MKKLLPVLIILIFIAGGLIGWFAHLKIKPSSPSAPKNVYLSFSTEVWDKIKENYWEKISDDQLADLFIAGTEKLLGQPQNLKVKNKDSIQQMISGALKQIAEPEKKKEFVATLADLVLANLQPVGRSRLYTKKDEKALVNNVNNVSGADQYGALDVPKEASADAIQKAYEQKVAQLEPQAASSPEAKKQLAQAKQAYKVLGDEANRKTYDNSGAEPTIDARFLRPGIFYLPIQKFSPTTLDELTRAVEKSNQQPEATALILDLRNNIGGAIDGLPWFLGPFIGPDQYAYQFYHQDERTDYKTRSSWLPALVKFKKVVVLINENTQSTAELMAAALKRYNVGVLVGTTTKGWGTIEKVFEVTQQLDQTEKYSIFLVHSLALREDNQPIEGRGVEPTVSLKEAGWPNQLNAYFNYPELIEAINNIVKT